MKKLVLILCISVLTLVAGCHSKRSVRDRNIHDKSGELQISETVSLNEDSSSTSNDEGWEPVSESSIDESYIDYDSENEVNGSGGLENIHFEFDSYALTEEARNILFKNAQLMKADKNMKIIIEGHCDDRSTEEYNLALGDRRAESAKNYLVSIGISSSRIQTISYGEELPIDPGQNEAAWAKNRRCHFEQKN